MSIKTLLASLLAALVLVGCASGFPWAERKTLDCASNKCEVEVSVRCFFAICRAAVDYETVVVKRERETEIVWRLRDASYSFPDNGVLFLEGREEFRCALQGNKQTFACRTSARSRPGKFKYTVNVRGPRTVPPLDPWVVID